MDLGMDQLKLMAAYLELMRQVSPEMGFGIEGTL